MSTSDQIQRLPETLSRVGNHYRLYRRGENSLIYQEVDQNGNGYNSFEVFRIRVRPAGEQFGKWYPTTEMFPSSEAFGKTAWWCNSLEKALEYFEKLEGEEKYGHLAAREGYGGEDLPLDEVKYHPEGENEDEYEIIATSGS